MPRQRKKTEKTRRGTICPLPVKSISGIKPKTKILEQILEEVQILSDVDQERIFKFIRLFKQEFLVARSSDETSTKRLLSLCGAWEDSMTPDEIVAEIHSARSSNQAFDVSKLKTIMDLASRIYSSEGLRDFLSRPQSTFNGQTAYDLIAKGEYETIVNALSSDLEGVGF
jgi:hypothetical protein